MKFYDKILLLVAVVLVGLGIYFYMQASGQAGSLKTKPLPAVAATEYTPGSIPTQRERTPTWPAPPSQDPEGLWTYRVFTPPILYNNQGVLSVQPETIIVDTPDVPLPDFGVEFSSLTTNPFRFRLESVFEEELDNLDTARLVFADREAGVTQSPTFTMRAGERNEERGLTVTRVRRERNIDSGGGVQVDFYADIVELESGATVSLRNNETTFIERPTIELSSPITGETVQVTEVGQTFTLNQGEEAAGEYTVLELDLDRETILLQKKAEYLDEPQTQSLRLRRTSVPQPVSPSFPSNDRSSPGNNTVNDDLNNLFD